MGISVGGLSGLDTDKIVSQLIELERIPITKLESRISTYEEQDSAFEDFNLKLLNLKTAADKLTNRDTWASMSTSVSDTSVLTAVASSTAAQGTYVFEVASLGQQTWSKSQNDIAANSLSTSTELDTLQGNGDFAFGLGGSGTGTFKVQLKDSSDNVVSEAEISYDTTTDTLNSIITKINKSSAGITAFYDETSTTDGKFVLTANNPGEYYIDVDAAGDTQGLVNTLQLVDTDWATVSGGVVYATEGSATVATLNGVSITPSGNSYEVNGITINFTKGDNSKSTVTVKKDTDTLVNSVNDFVSKYNDVQDFIKEQTSYKDGAAGGPLAGNFLVSNVGFNLNTYTLKSFSELSGVGQYSMVSQIGISLGQYGTTESNHLVVDESKLRAAIESNPEQVQLLFGFDKDNPTETNVVHDSGIAYNLSNYLTPITKFNGMIDSEQDALKQLIEGVNDQIEREERRIETLEETYRRQFSAMEQQLSMLNSQGDYFASQLAGLSG